MKMKTNTEIGKMLSELRSRANLTQKELASIINVSQSNICKCENGTGEPRLKDIILLSSIYNVSIETLLGAKIKELKKEKIEAKKRLKTLKSKKNNQ